MTRLVNADACQHTANLKNLYGQHTALAMTVPAAQTIWQSPFEILLSINGLLHDEPAPDHCTRTVNFMIYELSSRSQQEPLTNRLHILNEIFFNTKNFCLENEPFDLQTLLQNRSGSPICLALLYMHLAQSMDLKMQLVHWPLHAVLRCQLDNKPVFVDLSQKGQLLTEEELLRLIQLHREQLKTLSLREAGLQYLSYAVVGLRQKQDLTKALQLMDIILEIEPENMRYLAERALLKKELGLLKESLADFKRYFSFVDPTSASGEILANYSDLTENMRTEI